MTVPQRGNQLGLRPMDQVVVSLDEWNNVNDLVFNHDRQYNAVVAGYTKEGYPFVFVPGIKTVNQYRVFPQELSEDFRKYCDSKYGRFDNLAHEGSFAVLHSSASFGLLNKRVAKPTIKPRFNVQIGDMVRVFARQYGGGGIVSGQTNATRSYLAIVTGCNAEGEPLLVLASEGIDEIGFPLQDAYENGKPRYQHAVDPTVRSLIVDLQHGRGIWINDPSYIEKANGMHKEPLFGLRVGDKVELSYSKGSFDYEFARSNDTIEGTIVGHHTGTGSPIVGFSTVNPDISDECFYDGSSNLNSITIDCDGKDYAGYAFIGATSAFNKIIRKVKKMPRKEVMDSPTEPSQTEAVTTSSGMMDRIKQAGMNAPIRAARMQALTNGKKAILSALEGRVDTGTHAMIETVLGTDVGQGVILGAIGLAGPSIPKIGEDPRVKALCEEFLNEGVAKGFNEGLNLLASILGPALASAVAALPPVATAVKEKLPKGERKRVGSDESQDEDDEEETDDEELSAPKRKSI